MKQKIEVLRAYLPESILYLMTIISVNSALILVKNHGGSHIEIPRNTKSSHWLIELIGLDDFDKLCREFGSCALEIPRCTKLMTLARDIAVLKDKKAGLSKPKLAVKYETTERNVRRILKRTELEVNRGRIEEIRAAIKAIL